MSRFFARVFIVCLVAFVAPAGSAQDASVNYEKAVQAYHEDEYEAAFIHLKNALRDDPNHVAARLLLAQLYFNSGDIASAEKESAEALLLGADINLVLPVYGQSLLLQQKLNTLFEIESATDSFNTASKFEWALLKGQAYLQKGDEERARKEFEKAALILPNDTRSSNALAAIYLGSDMNKAAAALIERSLALDANNEKTWQLRGELAYKEKDDEKALEYFRKGFSLAPDDINLQRSLARLHLQRGDRDSAQQYLDLILEQSPEDPAATLLSAILLIGEGDAELGEGMLASLSTKLAQLEYGKKQSDDAMLFIQASAEYVQGNDQGAMVLFNTYLSRNKDDIAAIRLLADLYLRNGEIDLATDLLSAREAIVTSDLGLSVQLLGLYIQSGNTYSARELLRNLKQAGEDGNPYVMMLEANILRSKGQSAQAVELLNGGDFGDSEPLGYGLIRGALYLDLGQYAEAEQTVESLRKRFPDNVKVGNLAAVTYLFADQLNDAQRAIEDVLRIAPEDADARFNQAMLYKKRGELDAAIATLEALVEESPNNTRALLLLARIQFLQGNFDQAIAWSDRVYAYDNQSSKSSELQVEVYTQTGNWDKARLIAQRLVREDPLNTEYLVSLAEIAMNLQDVDLIHNTLSRLYPLWNTDAEKLRRLADMQLRSGNTVDARKSLEKALTLEPKSYPVRADLVRLDLAENEFTSAQKRVTALQDEFGDRTQTSYLLGEIALARGEPEAAQRYFMSAFELDADNTDAILKLYQLGMQGVGTGAFAAALETALKTASLPPWAVRMLADSYLQQGEEKRALLYYEKLLDLPEFAEDPGVLNNLANIYANEDLDKALVTARKALALEGEQSSALLDTVGWILARQGKNEEALPYLRKAYTQNAGDPEIRFHTGMVLLALDRTAEARVELQAALASPRDFAARPEAERILSTL